MAAKAQIDYKNRQDYQLSGKQMLVLTIFDIDGEAVLKIESEPHYWRKKRLIISELELGTDNLSKSILDDFQLCWDIGWNVMLDQMIPHYEPSASILSIQEYPGFPIMRVDEEKYIVQESRQLVDQISLPSLNKDEILKKDSRLLQAIGKRVLGILLSYEQK